MVYRPYSINKASIACLMRALILQQDGSIMSFAHRAGLPQPPKKNRRQASSKPVRRQPARTAGLRKNLAEDSQISPARRPREIRNKVIQAYPEEASTLS